MGAGIVVNRARIAIVSMDLGLCHYEVALIAARRLFDDDPLPFGIRSCPTWSKPASVEATGPPRKAMARLGDRAVASGTRWAMGLLVRSQALLAADDESERLYFEAIDLLGSTYVVTGLARTHLLYGE